MAANLTTVTTSSFVAEVLATAGRVEKEDIIAKITKLSKHVDELKVEVHDTLQRNHVEFYPSLSAALELRERVRNTSEGMKEVETRLEKEIKSQLNVSAAEFHDLSTHLEVANHTLSILDHLVEMNKLQQAVETSLDTKDYTTAGDSIDTIDVLLSQIQREVPGDDVVILSAIRDNFVVQKRKLVYDLSEMWSEHVKWTLPKAQNASVELTIASADEAKKRMLKSLKPMWRFEVLADKLCVFGKRFVRHVVSGIVAGGAVSVDVGKDQRPSVVITVGERSTDDSAAPLSTVFGNLIDVFTAINEHLLGLQLLDDSSSPVPLMRKLGEIVSVECLGAIVDDCLAKMIPSSTDELERYGDVVLQTEVFRDVLVKLHFITSADTMLMDYVNDVNVLYATKQCEDALETARSLLTADIHSMVLVEDGATVGEIAVQGFGRGGAGKATSETMPLSCNAKLSGNTFKLPTCNISVSTQKLLQLAYNLLHEAATGSESCAYQMFYAVRSMFELFCIVVLTFHKQELQNLPQVAALHHNNCMYLAHHLLTMGPQFQSQLTTDLSLVSVTFVDLVPKLRRLGTECFIRCLQKQRDGLTDCLANAKGFNGVSDSDTYSEALRAINQMLLELQHLGRVWTVLPSNVYYKSMGTLLNSAIVAMMSYITALEDISADDAALLHTLLSIVPERAPDCFQPPVGDPDGKPELYKYVAKWLKYNELMLVLRAGLTDIVDRWADGKGPLAQEFSGAEIKQLVRALFQNTERRSVVLAKLR